MEKTHKSGHFLDGFFWGAVIGGGVAYVLSTKKGREVVKELIQEGIDTLEDLAAPEDVEEISISEPEPPGEVMEVQEPTDVTPSKKKRFFRNPS